MKTDCETDGALHSTSSVPGVHTRASASPRLVMTRAGEIFISSAAACSTAYMLETETDLIVIVYIFTFVG